MDGRTDLPKRAETEFITSVSTCGRPPQETPPPGFGVGEGAVKGEWIGGADFGGYMIFGSQPWPGFLGSQTKWGVEEEPNTMRDGAVLASTRRAGHVYTLGGHGPRHHVLITFFSVWIGRAHV